MCQAYDVVMRKAGMLAVAVLLTPPLFAQAPYVQRIEVSVVNVDVTVTDKHGDAVPGLKREDFEIFEDGAPQPVTNFYAVEHAHERTATASTEDPRFRRKVLLLIDKYSLTAHDRDRALRRVEEFIDDRFRGGEYDWSIASVGMELQMLLPPTSDKAAIHEAISQIRHGNVPQLPMLASLGSKPLSFFDRAALRDQSLALTASMDAIVDATRAFGATEGKKVILLVTSGLLAVDWNVPDLNVAKWLTTMRNGLIAEANASNVSLYIINPEGASAANSAMYWIAHDTGGRVIPGPNVERSLQQFDVASSNYYSLGYRPSHADDARYHRIEVRVHRANVVVQYRTGYSSLSDEVQAERTFDSPFGVFMVNSSAIPITLAFDTPRDAGDALIVPMKTIVPAAALQFLPSGDGTSSRIEIYISAFDAAGRSVRQTHLTRDATLGKGDANNGTFVETTEMYFKKNNPYRVVVAVRDDATEAIGVIQQIVQY